MKAISLKAQLRSVTGKKVKQLRNQDLLPVDVYGKGMESVSLSVSLNDFMTTYKKAGATGLVELQFDDQKKPTLIKHVQFHPVQRIPLHAEFQAVKLSEKIKANVPLVLVGESPVVASNTGIILQSLNEVEVEAFPQDLPENISINAESLTEIDQRISVSDLVAPEGVEILTPSEEIVVSVASAVSEETQKEMEEEAAAKAAEETSAEGEAEGTTAESSEQKPEAEEKTEA